MSEAKLRAGMIGAGNMCEFHVAAVRALPDVEVVGVVDAYLAVQAALSTAGWIVSGATISGERTHGRFARARSRYVFTAMSSDSVPQ